MAPPIHPEDPQTAVLPQLVITTPPPVQPATPPSVLRKWLPWAGFGLVAIVVVAATTAWASSLRPAADSAPLPDLGLSAPIEAPTTTVAPEESLAPVAAAVLPEPTRAQVTRQPVKVAPAPVATHPPAVPTSAAAVTPTVPPTTTATQPAGTCRDIHTALQVRPTCPQTEPAFGNDEGAPAPAAAQTATVPTAP